MVGRCGRCAERRERHSRSEEQYEQKKRDRTLCGAHLWDKAVGLIRIGLLVEKSSTSHPPFNWAPRTLLGRKPTFQQLTEESSVSPICNAASFLFLVPSTLFFIIFFL